MSDLIRWELINNAGMELTHAIKENTQNAKIQSEGIRSVSQSFTSLIDVLSMIDQNIFQITTAIRENVHKNQMCSNEVLNAASAMQKLEDEFRSVNDLLRVIDSVASQTNLLALNATIEAARAGDAGRGFSVVANEVKELSKSTKKVNTEIQDTMMKISEAVSKLSGQLRNVQTLIAEANTTSEQSRISADSILDSSKQMQNRTQNASTELDHVSHSLKESEVQLNEMAVIGKTFENMISLLKFQGVFDKLNDPLERLGPLVQASTYQNNERFSKIQGEVILGEQDVLISITDTKGIIQYANKTFCRLAGYQPEELMGKPHNIVRHPDMPKTAFQDLWDVLNSKQVWQGYVKNKTKTGGFYWVKATVFPCINSAGQITGHISVRFKPPREAITRAMEAYRKLP